MPVFDAVADHLRRCGQRAHRDWAPNQANEDSLTGAAFADFRTRRTRRVYVRNQEWRWRVTTRKFRSAGRGSEERLTGADGIVEVEVLHEATGRLECKGLLVQAKKIWSGRDKRLLGQVRDMESLAPGSSAAIDYAPGGYTGIDGRSIILADGHRRDVEAAADLPLGDYLADRFLACEVGLRGLHYDPRRRILHLPSTPNGPDAVSFLVPHRMRIEIEEIGGAQQTDAADEAQVGARIAH